MIPERWLRIEVEAATDAERGLAVEVLIGHGARSVIEDADRVVTFLPPPDDPVRVVGALAGRLRAAGVAGPPAWRWQVHEDWSDLWKQGLRARPIGSRLMVAPTWVDVPDAADRHVLRIDPGVAFGTAEHATTRGCLVHLDQCVSGGETVLDVGCGSGILAIAAVRLGATHALGVELDPMACAAAAENVERNSVTEAVEIRQMDVPVGTPFGCGHFDFVIANMVIDRLLPRIEGLVDAMRPGGLLIVGGIQDAEVDRFTVEAGARGLALQAAVSEDGWWSGRFDGRFHGRFRERSTDSASV